MDKANDNKKITEKFLDIFSRIDREKPGEQNLKDVQNYLLETHIPTLTLQKISRNQIQYFIANTFGASGMKTEPVLEGIEEMRQELGYSGSSSIEQLLIDEIIQEFLRTHQMQIYLTTLINTKGMPFKAIRQFDCLLKSAQNRFHKSIQMLTNLRKSRVNLQINIAAEGGQQMNLQK